MLRRTPCDRSHASTKLVRKDRPTTIEAVVTGDLSGIGIWSLTRIGEATHVRFDWKVGAGRRFIRVLTPVLAPLFRWNHNWAIKRAKEGLEPYARLLAGL